MIVAPGHVGGERERGQHDRHGAAQPGPGDERLLRPRHAEPDRGWRAPTAAGPRSSSAPPISSAGPSASTSRCGRDQQAEQHEQPDLGQRGHALGEADAGRAVRQRRRCRAPARTGRRRRSPTCAPATPRRTRARRARGWPAGRSPASGSASAAQQLHAAEPDRHADHGAADQLADHLDDRRATRARVAPPVSRSASAATSRITGASLSPLSASSAAAMPPRAAAAGAAWRRPRPRRWS